MKRERVAQNVGLNQHRRWRHIWQRTALVVLAWALAMFSLALLNPPTVNAARLDGLVVGGTATAGTATTVSLPTIGGPTVTPYPTNPPAPTPTATPTLTTYNFDLSSATKAAGWPQSNSNWCGIATIAGIADFVKPGAGVTQNAVNYVLTDKGNESEWGTPSWNGIGPYIPTDIARDFGTDPRSIAEGLAVVTGSPYHVIVDTTSAWDATIHMVNDILNSHQPISVFVDHGEHSVLVSGVDATADPRTHPDKITGIHVWDPGGGNSAVGIQQYVHMDVPINQWLSGQIGWSGQYYFAKPYASNDWNGIPLDPDPSVGPYSYQSDVNNHMWIGHWVYVSAVAGYATAQLNADWELTPSGSLYVGYKDSGYPAYPVGYRGPMTPMPTTTPPPPLPLGRPPVIAARTPWHGTPPKFHPNSRLAMSAADEAIAWPMPTVLGFWVITALALLLLVFLLAPPLALAMRRARRGVNSKSL